MVWPLLCKRGGGRKCYEEVQKHLLTSSAHSPNVLSHRHNNFLQSEFVGIGQKTRSPSCSNGFQIKKKHKPVHRSPMFTKKINIKPPDRAEF